MTASFAHLDAKKDKKTVLHEPNRIKRQRKPRRRACTDGGFGT
jgi:hypothetical protein